MAIQISGTTVIDNSRNITGVRVKAGNVFQIPAGNTASRPGSPVTGYIRFNTQTNDIETWNGSAWILTPTTT